ncbi:MAG: tyrosine-type recombinase/integrase [Bacteroidota bacterium]
MAVRRPVGWTVMQTVSTSCLEGSGVNAHATVRTLRHSYATCFIENGFSIAMIQESLGHEPLKTSERYLQFYQLH